MNFSTDVLAHLGSPGLHPPRRHRQEPHRLSRLSPSGKTPTPTFPSWSKPKQSTRSCI